MSRCTQCQFENIEGALFCDQCGSSLDDEALFSGMRARHNTATLVDPGLIGKSKNRPDTVILDDRVDGDGSEPAADVPPDTFFLVTPAGRRIPVPSQEQVILGRADSRSGVRPDIDLSLEAAQQAGVSRRHCRLIWRTGQWLVEDLMSTNYTLVNGARLPSHSPTPISVGDELRLGKLVLLVEQGIHVG
ncbi:MAG: forkhead-associated protein [Chloroflexi bacterium]|nr:forkhead-associated protein [Chloroflexota bacterium]